MIICIGEALIDFKNNKSYIGGCPYNVSLSVSRQGAPVSFIGGISSDENGSRILESIIDNCILFDPIFCSSKKRTMTTKAIVENNSVNYKFDWKDTSAFDITREQLEEVFRVNTDIDCAFFGSVTFTDIEARTELTSFLATRPELITFFDPNIRPDVIEDMDYYRDVLNRSVSRCNVVKLSDEDLKLWGVTEKDALELCKEHLIVTKGSSGAVWYNKKTGCSVKASSYPVEKVVDTIGCGDTFSGSLLSLFYKNDKFSNFNFTEEEMKLYLDYSCKAASINCTREGCEPPTAEEIDEFKI